MSRNDVPIATIIDRAIAVIEERGWCQGRAADSQGRVCMEQALFVGAERLTASYWEVANHIKSTSGWQVTLVGWNDTPGRTVEEVLELLRHAKAMA